MKQFSIWSVSYESHSDIEIRENQKSIVFCSKCQECNVLAIILSADVSQVERENILCYVRMWRHISTASAIRGFTDVFTPCRVSGVNMVDACQLLNQKRRGHRCRLIRMSMITSSHLRLDPTQQPNEKDRKRRTMRYQPFVKSLLQAHSSMSVSHDSLVRLNSLSFSEPHPNYQSDGVKRSE